MKKSFCEWVTLFFASVLICIMVVCFFSSPSCTQSESYGQIKGRVIDQGTKQPLAGTNISIPGTILGGTTNADGTYLISGIPAGEYTIRFSYMGYEGKIIKNILIKEGSVIELDVELVEKVLLLKEITVMPGQFSIMGSGPVIRQSLTYEDIQNSAFGEDIYRAVSRLPGVSTNDFSSKFTVRGGENEEILVLYDGLELYEPFHQKDISGGLLSIIDVAAIEGIDLLTGGFSAEYGDRMSGVFNIESKKIPGIQRRTEWGISFMNMRMLSEGRFNNDRGAWLFSARRGYLDLVLKMMDEENTPTPTYWDMTGKMEYQLDEKHSLSVNFLHAHDDLQFVEDDDDENDTNYGNSYLWLNLKSIPVPALFIQTVVSAGRIKHERNGLAFRGDGREDIDFRVTDKRTFDVFNLKQDFNYELSNLLFFKWGYDVKFLQVDYDYFSLKSRLYSNDLQHVFWQMDTTRKELTPSGSKYGFYLSNRFKIISPLTTEVGMRYDYNSYTHDNLWSPRVNLVYELGNQTFVRGGWGYFYQTQGIHQISVGNGEDDFYPAQLAEHWLAGFEHYFKNGVQLRLEGYYKDISDLRPAYRKWSNVLEVFPELQDDKYELYFNGARAKGFEAYFKYDKGGKVSCWASYALAFTEDNPEKLIFENREYDVSGYYPRAYDQRHTFSLDLNYRPNKKWHTNISWQFHSGWPYTRKYVRASQLPDGQIYYVEDYSKLNGQRYPAYHRLDLKVSRNFYFTEGKLSLFLQLINMYNRKNVRSIKYEWEWDLSANAPRIQERQREYWFPLLPSLGVSWCWGR